METNESISEREDDPGVEPDASGGKAMEAAGVPAVGAEHDTGLEGGNSSTGGGASDYSPTQITEWLLGECNETGRKIDNYVRLDATLLSIALSLFAAAVGLALSRGYPELLLGLPFTFSLYFCIMQYFHGEFLGLAGYKAALEETITARVGPIVFWESEITPSHHNSKTPKLTWTTFGAIYVAGAAAAVIESVKYGEQAGWPHRHAPWLVVLTSCSIALGALLSALAFTFSLTEFDRVKKEAQKVLNAADFTPARAPKAEV